MSKNLSNPEIECSVRSLHHLPMLEEIAKENISHIERLLATNPPKRMMTDAFALHELACVARQISYDLASDFGLPSQTPEVRYKRYFERGDERFDAQTDSYVLDRQPKTLFIPTLTYLMAMKAFEQCGLKGAEFNAIRQGMGMHIVKHEMKRFSQRMDDENYMNALYLDERAIRISHPQEYLNERELHEICSVDAWISGFPDLAQTLSGSHEGFEQRYRGSLEAQTLAYTGRPTDISLGNVYVQLMQKKKGSRFVHKLFASLE